MKPLVLWLLKSYFEKEPDEFTKLLIKDFGKHFDIQCGDKTITLKSIPFWHYSHD